MADRRHTLSGKIPLTGDADHRAAANASGPASYLSRGGTESPRVSKRLGLRRGRRHPRLLAELSGVLFGAAVLRPDRRDVRAGPPTPPPAGPALQVTLQELLRAVQDMRGELSAAGTGAVDDSLPALRKILDLLGAGQRENPDGT